jgi:tetratricopeptide (TPR) repeat protein
LVTLLPVIGLVQVGLQATADRYSYVPLIGVFMIVAWGAWELAPQRPALRRVVAAAAFAWVAALATASGVQAGRWRDSRSLASHAARVAPSAVALMDLAITARLEGSSSEALELLRRARDLDPSNVLVLYNLGWVHESRQEWVEALECYRQAAILAPRDVTNSTSLGALLFRLGRYPEAVPWLEEALRFAPEYDRAHSVLGAVLLRLGERRRAEIHLTAAVRLNPGDTGARLDLGKLCLTEGRQQEAAAHLGNILRIDPGNREARVLLERLAGLTAPRR